MATYALVILLLSTHVHLPKLACKLVHRPRSSGRMALIVGLTGVRLRAADRGGTIVTSLCGILSRARITLVCAWSEELWAALLARYVLRVRLIECGFCVSVVSL